MSLYVRIAKEQLLFIQTDQIVQINSRLSKEMLSANPNFFSACFFFFSASS